MVDSEKEEEAGYNEKSNNDSGKPEDQAHYQGLIQPIELMQELLSHNEFVGFCKGNMIKYAYRAGHKKGNPVRKTKRNMRLIRIFSKGIFMADR